MTKKDYIELIITGLTAVGTILLAIIAVFAERVKRWLFKPRIEITVSSDKPYVSILKDSSTKSIPATVARIRIKILNLGSTSAQSFIGLIESIYCKRPESDTFYKMKSLSPTTLPFNEEEKNFSITPKIPIYQEIARIEKNESPSQDIDSKQSSVSEYGLFISVEEEESKGAYIYVGKGTFIIPITFYADNIKIPIIKYFEIFWDGTDPNTMKISNFYIKILPSFEARKKVEDKL